VVNILADNLMTSAMHRPAESKLIDPDQIISASFAEHYATRVRTHGDAPPSADWPRQEIAEITYKKILAVIRDRHRRARPSLLDVGCGYGGLLEFARNEGYALDYVGIDIVPEMIEHARRRSPRDTFILGDAITYEFDRQFDYVVCVGIMTMKLKASILDMNRYASRLIRKMFALSKVGISFDIMTDKVNFMVENSYYRSPVEILAFCLSELSTKLAIDHAYERYEYTTYVFHENEVLQQKDPA
jgi:SAM-dependent methyltransferase